jgi:hypothetical protein
MKIKLKDLKQISKLSGIDISELKLMSESEKIILAEKYKIFEPEPDEGKSDEGESDEGKSDDPIISAENELFDKIRNAKKIPIQTDIPTDPEPSKETIIKRTREKKVKGKSDPDSFRIEGYILLVVMDTVFPLSIAVLNNLFDKKIKMEASDLKMDSKDMKSIEPLADQCADYLTIKMNPVTGFILVSTFLYANNYILARTKKTQQIGKP